MNHASNLPSAAVLPAARTQAAAIARPAAARLTYIDTLRTIMCILVIMVHAAVTYGALGDWTYEDPIQDELSSIVLSFFVILSQSFFMGLFFYFSGYFTPGSYDRKGALGFWKDRLLRLGLPFLAYTFVFSKLPNYIDEAFNHGLNLSFWQFFVRRFWTDLDAGPTWFLFALLVFSAGYSLVRLATRKLNLNAWVQKLPQPGIRALLAFALALAALMFSVGQANPIADGYRLFDAISLMLTFFPSYILLFTAGVMTYRSRTSTDGDWLARMPGSHLRFWGWLSAGLAIFLPLFFFLGGAADGYLDQFMTGLNWRCATLSLWFGLAAVTFSITLTLWLRSRIGPNHRLTAFTGPTNFAVYFIHPLVLVPITLALSYLSMLGLLKFTLASAATVVICFLLASLIRRIPGMKAIF